MEYSKNRLIQNILYLCDMKGITTAELERKAGVSKGYISRVRHKKDDAALPLYIVANISDVLKISIDLLLSIDFSGIDGDTLYKLNLMKSMEYKTEARKANWERMDTNAVRDYLNGSKESDLTVFQDNKASDKDGSSFACTDKKVYKSLMTNEILRQEDDPETEPAMPWFRLEIGEGLKALLTCMYSQSPDYADERQFIFYSRRVVELYLVTPDGVLIPVGTSTDSKQEVKDIINGLYDKVYEHRNDIRISENLKNVLDKYML